MCASPLVTVAVPSFNQGRFLNAALSSIFEQELPLEVFVVDGGSTDCSIDVIKRWESKLSGWRSHADSGQAAAINEAVASGKAPYVCWLNSDDLLLPGCLSALILALEQNRDAAAAYGRAWNFLEKNQHQSPTWVVPFNEHLFAVFCFISQPASLIRRSAWEAIGGLDESLHMALDYDLWWKLYKRVGRLIFVDQYVAINREHEQTKTRTQRRLHYSEAIAVVRKHYGRVPLKWWMAQPYAVWWRSFVAKKN